MATVSNLGSIGLESTLGDCLKTITTGSRSELTASSLDIKNGPVWVRLNHPLASRRGTRVGIGSYNRVENPSSCRNHCWFDSVAKSSECPDHSRGADSLGLFAY